MSLCVLTLDDYLMGREARYPITSEQRANAEDMVRKVNLLLTEAQICTAVSSGYRPAAINAVTPGAAKRSKHMDCNACDLADASGSLDAWCKAHLDVLAEIGLWLEHPSATRNPARFGHGWCHVQRVPPKSGNRVFYP